MGLSASGFSKVSNFYFTANIADGLFMTNTIGNGAMQWGRRPPRWKHSGQEDRQIIRIRHDF